MSSIFLRIKHVAAKQWFGLSSVAILTLSAILRFYQYPSRWGLAFDQAHDVILAQYALSLHKLPLLGPFSSAGPFQTGGEWYWFIMLGRLLFPYPIQGPWIFLTLSQVIFVAVMIYLGFLLGGKMLGLLSGILAAISPAGIAQAVNLTNQAPLNIVAAVLLIFSLLYLKTKKEKYLFFMGIFSTLGATIHLQGVPLFLFAFTTLILGKVVSKKGIFLFFLGLVLPLLPNIYSDIIHRGFNVKNMLQYYLHDQYKVPLEVLGRRWITYGGVLWPTLAGNILGNIFLGYGFFILGLLLLVKNVMQRNFKKEWILLILPFVVIFTLLKSVRTPIFDSYIMFLHPVIFLLAAGILVFLFKKNKIMGFGLLAALMIVALQKDFLDIRHATNWTAYRASGWAKVLTTKYPGKKFAIYDYTFRSTTESGPLVTYLQYANKLDDKGYKIGFGNPGEKESVYAKDYLNNEIKENNYGFVLIDLQSSSSAQLSKDNWGPINPSYLYTAQEEWYK